MNQNTVLNRQKAQGDEPRACALRNDQVPMRVFVDIRKWYLEVSSFVLCCPDFL